MDKHDWEEWSNKLDNRITKWLQEESEKTEDGYKCKRCGQSLKNRTVYCSIHDGYKFFKSCSGSGSVHTFYIPECPNGECENHRPSFWDGHLRLDGNTLRGPCYDC